MAKAAFRRLAIERVEPTPDNYARAYRAEAGETAPPALDAAALPVVERVVSALAARLPPTVGPHASDKLASVLAQSLRQGRWEQAERALDTLVNADALAAESAALARLVERLLAASDRSNRQWTAGRRKESAQRVLAANRGDSRRMQQRLTQLVASWDGDVAPDSGFGIDDPQPETAPLPVPPGLAVAQTGVAAAAAAPQTVRAMALLAAAVRAALPGGPAAEGALGRLLEEAVTAHAGDVMEARHVDALAVLCGRAERTALHRRGLFDQLGLLCRELTAGLGEMADEDSWAKGQFEAARLQLDAGLTTRSVRSVSELLRNVRAQHHTLREARTSARDALKTLINRMLSDLGDLGSHTDSFSDNVGRYADLVEQADSLESLTGVVSEMARETRGMQRRVGETQERLHSAHERATVLSTRVSQLEADLLRLSDEAATDPLTQIANRRGLMQAFEAEQQRQRREGSELAVALLDIDNFKRLNDELGHGTGDKALVALASAVGGALRPTDTVARYGGEEFVVLLPATALDEGQRLLTQVQRSLTGALFTHEQRQVYVTFSAGVAVHRQGERIEATLERADEALYEAKRTGKNRTCASA